METTETMPAFLVLYIRYRFERGVEVIYLTYSGIVIGVIRPYHGEEPDVTATLKDLPIRTRNGQRYIPRLTKFKIEPAYVVTASGLQPPHTRIVATAFQAAEVQKVPLCFYIRAQTENGMRTIATLTRT